MINEVNNRIQMLTLLSNHIDFNYFFSLPVRNDVTKHWSGPTFLTQTSCHFVVSVMRPMPQSIPHTEVPYWMSNRRQNEWFGGGIGNLNNCQTYFCSTWIKITARHKYRVSIPPSASDTCVSAPPVVTDWNIGWWWFWLGWSLSVDRFGAIMWQCQSSHVLRL